MTLCLSMSFRRKDLDGWMTWHWYDNIFLLGVKTETTKQGVKM